MKSWGVLGNAALSKQCCTKICPLNSGWESIKWSINSSPTQPFTFNRKRDRACMGRRATYSVRQLQKVESWRMSSSDEKNVCQLPVVPQIVCEKLYQTGQLTQPTSLCALYRKTATKRCQMSTTVMVSHLHRLLQQNIITRLAVPSVVSLHRPPIGLQIVAFHVWPH